MANAAPIIDEQTTALALPDKAPLLAPEPLGVISAFSSESAFVAAQRMAKALAASTLVPTAYQNNVPNCMIALELASRIGCSVFMCMQNLDIIHGNPSWRAKFLIATVNSSGRFSPIRYEWTGAAGTEEWGCRAVSVDKRTGESCVGPWVTLRIAKDEGWLGKAGSKWKTMPELMFAYRAAAFWARLFCPELSLGMHTAEEAIDTVGELVPNPPAAALPPPQPTPETEGKRMSLRRDRRPPEPPPETMREPGED